MFNHACTIAFTILSEHPEGEDFPPAMIRAAIQRRMDMIPDDELIEAVGAPFDTYEEPQP